jgi:hypothetical protein
MHKIPNIPFMQVEQRQLTRIMLPHACARDDVDRGIAIEIMAEVWQIIRAIIVEVQPSEDAYLPATFRMESIRQVYAGNGARPLNSYTVSTMGSKIIEELRKKPFGRDAFFLHQWRGTRGQTVHTQINNAPVACLADFTASLDYEKINPADWTVDMGMTVTKPKTVMLWRRDGLPKIVEKIYKVDSATAHRIVNSSSFQIDEEAQIDTVAGARHEPDQKTKRATGIHYFQNYHTVKEPTYKYPELNYNQISKDAGAKHISDLESIFNNAVEMTGGARLEIRIGLADVGRELLALADLVDLLVCVHSSVWW